MLNKTKETQIKSIEENFENDQEEQHPKVVDIGCIYENCLNIDNKLYHQIYDSNLNLEYL